jgi:hypothetical protein
MSTTRKNLLSLEIYWSSKSEHIFIFTIKKRWGKKLIKCALDLENCVPFWYTPRERRAHCAHAVERRRVYYKGEGGGFPQVRAMVSLVCLSCPWLVLAPKVLQLCTNHFVLVLCRSVWVNKLVTSS